MILSLIAAMARNRVIGINNKLPWHIPEDLKFFRNKTKGHMMVMGRKTFESFPGLLPGRLHVVITRQKDYAADGAQVFSTIMDAIDYCRTQTAQWGDEVFIIGGGEIYRETLAYADRIYLTEIQQEVEGDAVFPEFDKSEFKETERIHRSEPVPFDFVTYDRISPRRP
jgi:dihydrofolate reductase